jgi:hypothetical protein
MRRWWYWKVYFILMAALTVAGTGLSLHYWDETSSLDRIAGWASLPMYIVQLVGLLGFIYWWRIGSSLLWKFVFGATVLELVWVTCEIALETRSLSGDDLPFFVSMAVGSTVLLLPLLVALYIYAFRSQVLWIEAT